jgi:hypothetical protein
MASISISSVTISGWQGNVSGVQLLIYTNQSFTAASGNIYPQSIRCSPASLGTFYQSYACVVTPVGSSPPTLATITIPEVVLDSTVDSPDNPNATFSAVLWDSISGKQIQTFGTFSSFALNPSPTSTTWAAIFTAEADQ